MPDLSTVTHLPLDQQWLRDASNAGELYVQFEETVGASAANTIRQILLTRLAETVQICNILGADPKASVNGTQVLAEGQVWQITWFGADTKIPHAESGCEVYRVVFESLNTSDLMDFRLVSR